MLLSMTGYGAARAEDDRLSLSVEIRAVNNRYLKIACKLPEAYALLESRIEKVIREYVNRGTLQVTIRSERNGTVTRYAIDSQTLTTYLQQLNEVGRQAGIEAVHDLASLGSLPGVIVEADARLNADTDWPFVSDVLREALENLREFRVTEGREMAADLKSSCDAVETQLEHVVARTPQVVVEYRDKLLERVRELLAESEATLDAQSVLREVSVFADRCDINEEITRLRSHLEQFRSFIDQDVSMGRKLEFLGQEMFREINTIGAKANDVTIAHCVVEMKAAIERIREILQNVE